MANLLINRMLINNDEENVLVFKIYPSEWYKILILPVTVPVFLGVTNKLAIAIEIPCSIIATLNI